MPTLYRYCLALDLKPDKKLMEAYDAHHRAVWPEVLENIHKAGIEKLEIYRLQNRLFMILEANESFSFEKKNAIDRASDKVQDWETLMWKYQQALPFAAPGEKWMLMQKIFELS